MCLSACATNKKSHTLISLRKKCSCLHSERSEESLSLEMLRERGIPRQAACLRMTSIECKTTETEVCATARVVGPRRNPDVLLIVVAHVSCPERLRWVRRGVFRAIGKKRLASEEAGYKFAASGLRRPVDAGKPWQLLYSEHSELVFSESETGGFPQIQALRQERQNSLNDSRLISGLELGIHGE